MRKKIVVVTTGGTIASRYDEAHGDIRAVASGSELIASIPEIPPGIEVEVVEFCNFNSYVLSIETSFGLSGRVAELLDRDDVTGVVVTHGTDTIEESAFIADLVIASPKPVVFTGAMRTSDRQDRDGPANIANSIRLAASEKARGLGVLLCLNEEFHAARDATKTNASKVETFQSAEHGKLGDIDSGHVVVHRRPVLRAHYPAQHIEPNVDLIRIAIGTDGRFFQCAIDNGARGIVVEAFGRGDVTPGAFAGIREAIARGILVVITTRCPQGRVKPIYGDGGSKDVHALGAIFAGDLQGPKARILLAILLGRGDSETEIRNAFETLAG